MARDYGNLNAGALMGSVGLGLDGGQTVAAGAPWSAADIAQVDRTITQLQQSGQVSHAELDQATKHVQRGLRDPTYTTSSQTLIEAMYHLSPDAEAQARVASGLLAPDNAPLLRQLLSDASEANPLAERLGPQGVERLLSDVAAQGNPIAQTTVLFDWARSAVLAPAEQDTGVLNSAVQKIGLDMGGADPQFIAAVLDTDVASIKTMLSQSNESVSVQARRVVVSVGDLARTAFQQLALESDLQVRDLGVHGLRFLAEAALEQQQLVSAQATADRSGVEMDGGRTAGSMIDTAALESLLTGAESLPSTLLSRFGSSPALQASLLRLIVRA